MPRVREYKDVKDPRAFVVILNESDMKSVFSDIITFGWLLFIMFINNQFCGNSWVINVFGLLSIGVGIFFTRKTTKMTLEQTINYLIAKYETQTKTETK